MLFDSFTKVPLIWIKIKRVKKAEEGVEDAAALSDYDSEEEKVLKQREKEKLNDKGYYEEQEEIKKSIRENHRHLINFKEIDKKDFEVPQHIDKDKLNKCVSIQPVPYWRNIKYRCMCYFWIKHFIKYTQGFDYVMRLDDDSIIEETLKDDLFKIIHVDCGLCNYGMKELFESCLPSHTQPINNGLFISAKLEKNNPFYHKFNEVYAIVNNKYYDDAFTLEMPLMYYNNFFVTSTAFWKRDDVQNIIDKIDKHGGIFYYRYGDAPLQTLIVSLLEPEKISRAVFKYSKRLQREAFIDSENNIYSYMPKTYDKSSCITEK